MSKNNTIQEVGTGKQFTADKLKTNRITVNESGNLVDTILD